MASIRFAIGDWRFDAESFRGMGSKMVLYNIHIPTVDSQTAIVLVKLVLVHVPLCNAFPIDGR